MIKLLALILVSISSLSLYACEKRNEPSNDIDVTMNSDSDLNDVPDNNQSANNTIDFAAYIVGTWKAVGLSTIEIGVDSYTNEAFVHNYSWSQERIDEYLNKYEFTCKESGMIVGASPFTSTEWELAGNNIFKIGDSYAWINSNGNLCYNLNAGVWIVFEKEDSESFQDFVISCTAGLETSNMAGKWVYNDGTGIEVYLTIGFQLEKYSKTVYARNELYNIEYGNYARVGDAFITDTGTNWFFFRNDFEIECVACFGSQYVPMIQFTQRYDMCSDMAATGADDYRELINRLSTSCGTYDFAKYMTPSTLFNYLTDSYAPITKVSDVLDMPAEVVSQYLVATNDFQGSFSIEINQILKSFTASEISDYITELIENESEDIIDEYGMIPEELYNIEEAFIISGKCTDQDDEYVEEFDDWWILKISGKYYFSIEYDFFIDLY